MRSPFEDPLLRDARREAVAAVVVWAVALAYTIGFASRFAYGRDPESLAFVLGFPDWVFWGVLVPWAATLLITVGYSAFLMKDGDLGEE
jgi:hypothetical protein